MKFFIIFLKMSVLPTLILFLISIHKVSGFILHKYLSNVLCKLDLNNKPLFIS